MGLFVINMSVNMTPNYKNSILIITTTITTRTMATFFYLKG